MKGESVLIRQVNKLVEIDWQRRTWGLGAVHPLVQNECKLAEVDVSGGISEESLSR